MTTREPGLRFKLAVDAAGVTDTLGRVDASVNRLTGSIARIGHYTASIAGIGLALKALPAAETIRTADAVTELTNKLRLATGGNATAQRSFQALYEISQRSRVGFLQLGDTYASLARAGQQLGVSQQALLNVTEAVANAVAISGGSAQGAQAALVQLSQGIASGTLRGEELNSVMEQTPRLAQALADGLGVSIGRLRELGASGSLTASQVIGALEKAAPQLAREVQSATVTVGAAFVTLQNATTKTIGDFDRATGASKALASTLQSVASGVETIGRVAREHETALKVIGGLVGGAVAVGAGVGVVALLGKIAGGIGAVGTALAANPLVAALLGLGAVTGAALGAGGAYSEYQNSLAHKLALLETRTQALAVAERNLAAGRGAETEASVAAMRRQVQRDAQALAQASAADPSFQGLEERRLGRTNPGPYPDAKSVSDLAGFVRLDIDIKRQWLDEAVAIAKSYEQAMSKATDPAEIARLGAERDRRLIEGQKKTNDEIAKLTGGVGSRDAAAMSLERSIGEVERAQAREQSITRRHLSTLDAQREAGLVDEADYIEQRRLLALQDVATQEMLVRREIAAVQASGIEPKEKLKKIEAYNAELEKLRQQELDIEAGAGDARIKLDARLRDTLAQAEQQRVAVLRAARQRDAQSAEEAATSIQADEAARTQTLREATAAAEQQVAQYGLLRSRVLALNLAELERRRSLVTDGTLIARELDAQIELMRRQVDAAKGLERKERVADAAKETEAEAKRMGQQVEQTLTDALMRGFESGKGFARNLRDATVNLFRSLVLRPIISAVVNPVAAGITGLLGFGGTAAAQAAGGGAGSTLGTAASLAGSMGAFGSGVASGLTAWGPGGSVMGLLSQGSALFSGGIASGLGTIAGALGPIALGLMAVSKLFDSKGGPKQESWAGYSGAANDPWGRFTGALQSGGSAGASLAKDLASSITGTVKAALAAVGIAGALTTGVYASQDPKGDSPTQLDVQATLAGQQVYSRAARVGDIENVGRSEDDLKRAVARETLEVLLASIKASGEAVPRFVERLTKDVNADSTADEINAALQAVAGFPAQVLGTLGTSRDTLASAYVEGLKTGDATLAGQTFASTLMVGIQDAMLGNFAAQITDITTNSILVPIMDSLAAGATLADAMASANIEQAVAKAQAAADAFSAVWGNEAFQAALSTIKGAVQKVGTTAAQGAGFRTVYAMPGTASAAASNDADKPVDKARALSIEIARLEGRTLAAVAMQREDELKTLDTGGQILQQRVYDLQDEAAALEKTKALMAAFDAAVGAFQSEPERIAYGFERVARELKSLGVVGDMAIGDLARVLQTTGQDRIAEVTREFLRLNIVSDTTKTEVLGLVGVIGQLKSEAAEAERNLAGAGSSLADAYQEIVERARTSGERVRDALSGISDGYVTAQERVASAQETVGNLARQAASELREFAKDIRTFIEGIDSSDLGGRSKREQLAAARAQFAILSAQARAGDPEALKKLTGAAGRVLELSRETSRSQLAINRNADSVRATLGEIAADQERKAAAKLEGIADAQDPTAKALKDLATAQDDLARWSQAVSVSGAATERHTGDYLREWREATADDTAARADLAAATVAMQGIAVSQTTAMQRLSDAIGQYTAALLASDAYTGRNSAVPGPLPTAGLVSAGGPRFGARVGDTELRVGIDQALAQGGQTGIRAAFAQIAASGRSIDDAAALYGADPAAIREVAKQLGIPGFAVGTNFVPQDMLAFVHRGERILPAADNARLLRTVDASSSGSGQQAAALRRLEGLVERLTAEVVLLRQDNSAENFAIAKGSLESAAKLRKLDQIGIGARA